MSFNKKITTKEFYNIMQMPQKNNLWTFAVGGTSHSNYSDCPFRVRTVVLVI